MSKYKNTFLSETKLLFYELKNKEILGYIPKFCRTKVALQELLKVLKPVKHEGHITTYGVIFAESKKVLEDYVGKECILIHSKLDVATAQRFADGYRSFLTYIKKDHFYGVLYLEQPFIDELQYLKLSFAVRGAIYRVESNGKVSLYLGKVIASCENRQWFIKPDLSYIIDNVIKYVPQVNNQVLNSILEFCYYKLSSSKIGSTIVWCLRKPLKSHEDKMKIQLDLQYCNLKLTSASDSEMIRHLLYNTDGAIVIDDSTKILGAAAHLSYPDKSKELIPSTEGTRHTSARRFSYDVPEVIIFTSSSDGAVSVFSDGLKIGYLPVFSAEDEAKSLRKMVPPKKDDIYSESREVVCNRCGKTSLVEGVVVIGWKEREETNCELCGSEIYSSMCSGLWSHIIKAI